MISHCTCYCWKGLGHLRDGAGVSAILFVCSFADPTLFPFFVQVLSLQFLSYVLHAFKQTCWCAIRYRYLVCLLALIQIRAFSGVTTKRQSPDSLLSHAKIIYAGVVLRGLALGRSHLAQARSLHTVQYCTGTPAGIQYWDICRHTVLYWDASRCRGVDLVDTCSS